MRRSSRACSRAEALWPQTTISAVSCGGAPPRSAAAAPTRTALRATARTPRRPPRCALPGPRGRRQGAGIPGHAERRDRRHRPHRRQPRLLPARLRRELRPGRPVHQRRRRRLRLVQGADLLGQHSAQPVLQRADAAAEFGHGAHDESGHAAVSAGPVPGRLEHVQLQHPARHGRRQHRGVGGHAVLRPRRLQRSHDDRHTAGERPARHRLGQRPDRVRHPDRLHDQEHDDRGGLRREGVERQAAVPRQQVQQRRAEHAVDQLLHAERARQLAAGAGQRPAEVDAERRVEGPAVGFGDQLPRDAEQPHQQHRRRGHQPETDRQPVASDWCRLSEHRAQRVDVRRRHQDDDGQRVVGGQRPSRASTRGSTTSTTTSRTARRRSRTTGADSAARRARVHNRYRRARRTATRPPRRASASHRSTRRTTSSTRRTPTASTSTTGSTPARRSSRSTTTCRSTAQLAPAEESTINRAWIEYRNTKWANWSGRLRYQYLQQRSDLDHSTTNNADSVQPTTVPYYFAAYDVNNYDQNMVRLNVDWTPAPLLSVGFGATWRDTDFKDNYYGRTDDTDPALRPVDQLRRSGQVPHLGDRQLRRGEVQPGLPQHGRQPRPWARCRATARTARTSTGARKTRRRTGCSRCSPTGSRWTTSG